MTKNEVLTRTQEIAAEAEVKVSKKDIVVIADALYATITEAVKAGDKVKFNEITYAQKEVPERRGKVMMGANKGDEWVKPAHVEVSVKASKALKNLLGE